MKYVAALLCGVASLAGCDSRADSPAPPPRVLRKFDDVRGPCAIEGRVTFDGIAPVMQMIANQPCHAGAESPIREETVEVSDAGGLKNVLVHVESDALPPIDGSTLPPVTIDQHDCRYVPHVVAVCVNQPLRVSSSDAKTMHNVHYAAEQNGSGNFSMTDRGQERIVSFKSAETIRMRCDVHPWMAATVGVFDTPFCAVTDADGKFEIDGLPPGQYKLIAWHERYGELNEKVVIGKGAPAIATLTYKAP